MRIKSALAITAAGIVVLGGMAVAATVQLGYADSAFVGPEQQGVRPPVMSESAVAESVTRLARRHGYRFYNTICDEPLLEIKVGDVTDCLAQNPDGTDLGIAVSISKLTKDGYIFTIAPIKSGSGKVPPPVSGAG